jgi:hypothetical protein
VPIYYQYNFLQTHLIYLSLSLLTCKVKVKVMSTSRVPWGLEIINCPCCANNCYFQNNTLGFTLTRVRKNELSYLIFFSVNLYQSVHLIACIPNCQSWCPNKVRRGGQGLSACPCDSVHDSPDPVSLPFSWLVCHSTHLQNTLFYWQKSRGKPVVWVRTFCFPKYRHQRVSLLMKKINRSPAMKRPPSVKYGVLRQ